MSILLVLLHYDIANHFSATCRNKYIHKRFSISDNYTIKPSSTSLEVKVNATTFHLVDRDKISKISNEKSIINALLPEAYVQKEKYQEYTFSNGNLSIKYI